MTKTASSALQQIDTDELTKSAHSLMQQALRNRADAADVVVSSSASVGVTARLGKVEDTTLSEQKDVSIRVYVGKKTACVSTKSDRLERDGPKLIERAVAMANSAPDNPYVGLADNSLLARDIPDLDLVDTTTVELDELINDSIQLEEIGRDVSGISNSNGASAGYAVGGMVLVASNGFAGAYQRTAHSRSISLVAGSGTQMERDYDFDSRRHHSELRPLEEIAHLAAERTLARLNPRRVATQSVPILFDRRVSSSFLTHLAGAINAASVVRGGTFLKDRLGSAVFGDGIHIVDDPHLPRALGSRPFDADGIGTGVISLVEAGVLQQWILDLTSARELGLSSNGRAVFSGSGTRPSPTNLWLKNGDIAPETFIKNMKMGMVVTDFIGHGANLVTGDYSRGVSGFWVENGEIVYPVSELTVAGNLLDIFKGLVPANDLQMKGSINAPSIYVEGLTLAGA